MKEKKPTGYPSIDKPWLKYYSEEAINAPLPECTIYEYLWESNKDHLDDVALIYFGRKITYGQLFKNIETTAKAFSVLGIKEGDIVTICSVTTPEIIYAFYALNRLGAVSNMVDPRTSTEGIKHYIEEVNSKLVITIDVALPKIEKAIVGTKAEKIISVSPYNSLPTVKKIIVNALGQLRGNSIKLPANGISWNKFIGGSVEPRYATYKKNTCCVIVHTGGTTGTPKGVMLSNDNLNCVAINCQYCDSNYERNKIFLNFMPPFLAYGIVNGLHMIFAQGMTNVIIPNMREGELPKLINKYQPTHFLGAPNHYMSLIETNALKPNSLKKLCIAGIGADTLNSNLEKEINEYLYRYGYKVGLMKGYGMTEVSAAATGNNYKTNKIGSVGIPFVKNIMSAFNPDTNEECKYNERGEICINTPTKMLGYYNMTEETNMVIKKHADGSKWVHSGDIGYVDEDGVFFIEGRVKRMIIRFDGFKVFPAQIENIILKSNIISNCSTVGVTDRTKAHGMLPIVFVVLKTDINKQKAKKDLFELCKAELPEYAQPIDFIFIDELPLTPIGKVDYRKLEEIANTFN